MRRRLAANNDVHDALIGPVNLGLQAVLLTLAVRTLPAYATAN
jgi:hypothetical protein